MLKRVAIYSSEVSARTTGVINRLIDEFCRRGIRIQLYERSGELSVCPGGRMIEKFSELEDLRDMPE